MVFHHLRRRGRRGRILRSGFVFARMRDAWLCPTRQAKSIFNCQTAQRNRPLSLGSARRWAASSSGGGAVRCFERFEVDDCGPVNGPPFANDVVGEGGPYFVPLYICSLSAPPPAQGFMPKSPWWCYCPGCTASLCAGSLRQNDVAPA